MTTLEAPPSAAPESAPPQESDSVKTRVSSRRRAVRRVTRVSIAALVALAALFLLFDAFQGPVARVWYQTRQRQLSSDFFNGKHARLTRGDAVAIVQIPKYGVNVVVAQGDDVSQLRNGPGHRIGTPLPGARGNAVVTAHRSAWGSPFAQLGHVHKGDLIAVQTRASDQPIVYTVASVSHTSGSSEGPFARTNDYRLTLVTGDGGRLSTRRLVVTAVSSSTTAGKKARVEAATTPASISTGSRAVNSFVGLTIIGLLGLGAGLLALRRRLKTPTLLALLTPFALLALLGLLLEVDLFLPALR